MQLEAFRKALDEIAAPYFLNEPMSRHTTFKIGGNADIYVVPENERRLESVLLLASKYSVPQFIIGKGSNLLVSDSGIEGAVISLSGLDSISVDKNRITCGSGVSLSKVCTAAQNAGLSGLEFAYGIPGSAGGALYMNAGAYGGEMSQIVSKAACITADGKKRYIIDSKDMKLGYRTSIFKSGKDIITEITFELENGDKNKIKNRMNELISKRAQKQPLEYPSAGSTFKRPEGYFAGTLIEKNNLKGASCGAAQVSEKHAGFVINMGGASASDVENLINKIKNTVYKNDGVVLEPEIIFVGRR